MTFTIKELISLVRPKQASVRFPSYLFDSPQLSLVLTMHQQAQHHTGTREGSQEGRVLWGRVGRWLQPPDFPLLQPPAASGHQRLGPSITDGQPARLKKESPDLRYHTPKRKNESFGSLCHTKRKQEQPVLVSQHRKSLHSVVFLGHPGGQKPRAIGFSNRSNISLPDHPMLQTGLYFIKGTYTTLVCLSLYQRNVLLISWTPLNDADFKIYFKHLFILLCFEIQY